MRRLFSSLAVLLLLAAPARAGEIKLATWNLNWLTTRGPGDPLLPPELPGRGAEDFARLRLYAQRLAADVLALEKCSYCGVKLLATAHAESVDELHRRRLYRMLLETGVFRRALVLRADQQFAEEEIGL